ncbi:MAG TPA: Holliday junction branch migration protein RuvA [Syntrophomonadaceae bacterium]|jgi:Holliday junction DNA helicase RuvA|nr:Holliday junction branch migration protein RuvA [Syntrophomonadaceae bacterium]
MIAFLQGQLIDYDDETVLINVQGVGYEVQVNQRMLIQIPPPGSTMTVYTHMQLLENEIKLYGFPSTQELRMFKTLLTVSGIGARGAMNILGALDPESLARAIASGDEKTLLTAPGVGKKTAQRLIFELRDKISQQEELLQEGLSANGGSDRGTEEIMQALEALGYNRSEHFPLVVDMKARGEFGTRTEDNLKKVLKKIAEQMR